MPRHTQEDGLPLLKFRSAKVIHEPQGTFWTSVFALVGTMLGAGALSLPSTMAHANVVPDIVIFLFMAIISWVACDGIKTTAEFTGKHSFESMAADLFGPVRQWCVRAMTLVLLFGIQGVFFVISMDMLHPFVAALASRFTVGVVITAITIPLCLAETVYALRYTNALVIGCMLYIFVVVGVRAAQVGAWPADHTDVFSTSATGIIYALPIQALSYGCQINSARIYGELKDKTKMAAVNGWTMAFGFVVYVVFSVLGFICFKGLPPADILTGFAADDWLVNSVRLVLGSCIILKIPLIYQPFLQVLEAVAMPADAMAHNPKPLRVTATVVSLVAAFIVAITVKDLSVIMGFVGATGDILINFFVPGLFMVEVGSRMPVAQGRLHFWLGIILVLFSSSVAVLALIALLAHDWLACPPNIDQSHSLGGRGLSSKNSAINERSFQLDCVGLIGSFHPIAWFSSRVQSTLDFAMQDPSDEGAALLPLHKTSYDATDTTAHPPGTLIPSVVALLSTMLGVSLLSLPALFASLSLYPAMALLVTVAAVAYATYNACFLTCVYTDQHSYETVGAVLFDRIRRAEVRVLVAVLLLTTLTTTIATAVDLMHPVVASMVGRSVVGLSVAALAFPLCLSDTLFALRHVTTFALACVGWTLVVVAVRATTSTTPDFVMVVDETHSFWHALASAVPLFATGFGCHLNSVRVYGELADKVEMAAVNRWTLGLGLLVYVVVGVLGGLCFPLPPSNLLTGFAVDDRMATSARAAMTIHLILRLPLLYQPLFEIVATFFNVPDATTTTTPSLWALWPSIQSASPFRLMTTALVLLVAFNLASGFDNHENIDAIWSILVHICVPGLFLMEVGKRSESSQPKWMGIVLIFVGLTLFGLSLASFVL
ncbi:Aste57867_212 [Aphanomyces stellatus]|uniref:Aste57867_212 protein n=1 Tax=Aphanomyces stellatus TaxID=120398 RepID=A0A485K705_9STRA|nr:hypothetical protein As57867_000212 [Aphanomyces stellatus]VFT77438.1 Aste57867_212 [Aphanomyces stellatus]